MKLMATSDIHIGREPTNVPFDARKTYRTASIWENIINCAVAENVDALLIAGDIIDTRNKFFESVGPLEKGLDRLFEHKIPVFAVAGNHDYDVLPRIHETLKNPLFHLLGKNRTWDIVTHKTKSHESIQIAGYSFSSLYHEDSPLKAFPREHFDPAIPTVGLLHTDFEVPNSLYCPTTKPELRSTGVPLWIFGHVHKPRVIPIDKNMCAIYPGSPQGMDPGLGESGAHGPWIIEYSNNTPALRQIPLAPLRYDTIEIDVTGIQNIGQLQQTLHDKIRAQVVDILVVQPMLRYLSLRLNIVGTTRLNSIQIEEQLNILGEGCMQIGETTVAVNKANLHLSPEVDLNNVAQREDFKGQAAKFILQMKSEEEESMHHDFFCEMMELSKKLSEENPFFGTGVTSPTPLQLREILCCQANELLCFLSEGAECHESN